MSCMEKKQANGLAWQPKLVSLWALSCRKSYMKPICNTKRTFAPLNLICPYICGNTSVKAWIDIMYFITFINDHARYGRAYLLSLKSNASTMDKGIYLTSSKNWSKNIAPLTAYAIYATKELINWKKYDVTWHG